MIKKEKYTLEKGQSLQYTVFKNWTAICRQMKLNIILHYTQKITSKWVKLKKGKPENIKLEETHKWQSYV